MRLHAWLLLPRVLFGKGAADSNVAMWDSWGVGVGRVMAPMLRIIAAEALDTKSL